MNDGFAGASAGSCIYYASVQPSTSVCSAATGTAGATECVYATVSILNSVTFAKIIQPESFQPGSGFGYMVTAFPIPGVDAAYSVIDTVPWSKHPTTSLDVTVDGNVFFSVGVASPFSSTGNLQALEGSAAIDVLRNLNV